MIQPPDETDIEKAAKFLKCLEETSKENDDIYQEELAAMKRILSQYQQYQELKVILNRQAFSQMQ